MVVVSGKIRKVLIDGGLATQEDWTAAKARGGNLLENLVSAGAVSSDALLEALGRASHLPPVHLSRVVPDRSALERIAPETCIEHTILPLSVNGEVLTIVVCDPFDVLLLDDLRRRTGCQIQQVLSHPAEIKEAIESAFNAGSKQVEELMEEVSGVTDIEVSVEEDTKDIDLATASGDDAPAVKLVNLILLRALKAKASDIHIEPLDKGVSVRFRVDGRLDRVMSPPKALLPAINSRLKILAQLDIAERFTPQDGKFQIRYEGRQIDFRLSLLPVVGGEKAVLRILDAGSMSMRIEKMGYEPKALEHIREAIASPYGMLLITGPTGSGKSTTLYSCVQEVATPEINVTTVEDPVEYRMNGINQVAVNNKRGMTFASALRSILRQDPDVVLVGEIRDGETANIAVKAALTGHLVLSTLHTNDAASTITRLVDMGIDPFMVSSSLLCIGAQRLGRRLCEGCKQPVEVPEQELLNVGFLESELEGRQLFGPNPRGCPRCNLGYKGRFAILETLFFEETLRRMVVESASVHDIKREAVRQGMLTLRRVGVLNALRGITSLEEVLRVTLGDE
ncbi:MAG: Flp pilus assembly complex ATPase component TadA [Planctomycetes bacterium]|nr:Flp pilus assembly complex ATPase component TadA [Planctomycetota bacterium]